MATGLSIAGAIAVVVACMLARARYKQRCNTIIAKALLAGMDLRETGHEAIEFGCGWKLTLDDNATLMSNSKVGLSIAYLKSKGIDP